MGCPLASSCRRGNKRIEQITFVCIFQKSSSCILPACHELLTSVAFVLQAVAAVGSAKTGFGQAEIFAGPVALAGEQAVSLVRVAAAVGPKTFQQKGKHKGAHNGKMEGIGQSKKMKEKHVMWILIKE